MCGNYNSILLQVGDGSLCNNLNYSVPRHTEPLAM